MSRSPARRGQVEPLAAIAAVFAVGVGLAVYAGALDDHLPGSEPRDPAQSTLERVERAAERAGIVDPHRLPGATDMAPAGYRVNATLRADGRRWHAGPAAPPSAGTATTRTSVRLAPGRIQPGRLTVRVWS